MPIKSFGCNVKKFIIFSSPPRDGRDDHFKERPSTITWLCKMKEKRNRWTLWYYSIVPILSFLLQLSTIRIELINFALPLSTVGLFFFFFSHMNLWKKTRTHVCRIVAYARMGGDQVPPRPLKILSNIFLVTSSSFFV